MELIRSVWRNVLDVLGVLFLILVFGGAFLLYLVAFWPIISRGV